MADAVIRIVALAGGLLVGVIAWTAVALLLRARVLMAAGLDRLRATCFVLFGLLLIMMIIWRVGPVHGSPWIWPGVVVGIAVSALAFWLARSDKVRVAGTPFGRISDGP